jgi:hypothetical protein
VVVVLAFEGNQVGCLEPQLVGEGLFKVCMVRNVLFIINRK